MKPRPYQYHQCRYHGCSREATCMPRLYVPPSQFSPDRSQDVSALMGLPVCDPCFKKLTAKELLEGEQGAAIREQIVQAYAMKRAYPNFDKAVIGRISRRDHDWYRWEEMNERARAN